MMTVQISYSYLYEEQYKSLKRSSKWSGFVRSYKIYTEKISSVSG